MDTDVARESEEASVRGRMRSGVNRLIESHDLLDWLFSGEDAGSENVLTTLPRYGFKATLVSSTSHAFSFSRALYRCDTRFYQITNKSANTPPGKNKTPRRLIQHTFSAFSISAYVFPSYSKIGSHPTKLIS
jgi:hypothetical protein